MNTGAGQPDYVPGDFIVYSSDTPGSTATVNWTAPSAGSITIDGYIWYGHTGAQRSNNYVLRINTKSVPLASGTVSYNDGSNRARPIRFSGGGTISVNSGDIVSLEVYQTIGNRYGSFDGLNLSITHTPGSAAGILPQFVFGGGWYSALYFANTSSISASLPISFFSDDGNPLSVPSLGGVSTTTLNLAPHGTAVIEAPNNGPLNQGYASFSLPSGVVGHGVFRQSVQGRPDQEAVVPLSSVLSTTSTLIWDDTAYTTAVAVANPSPVPVSVSITAWDSAGNVVGTSSVSLAPHGKMVSLLYNLPGLRGVVGNRGSATFVVPFGSVAVLGLRFAGSAFTSVPSVQN
jgi:hypothetical protein